MKTYYKDWDVVFVDDGSKVGSLKVLEGLTVNVSVRHPYQLCCSQEKC
jgi:glycosyltransferase involved in cell wall biosynthesis